MKQYILLDRDGNLARTLDIWLEACRIAIEKHGIKKTDEEIAASFGQFEKHMREWGIKDIEQTIVDADTIAKQKLPSVELYPDALFVLEELHSRGKKLALITTSNHENVRGLLESHGISELFDIIIGHEDTVNHKPHAEPLELALTKLGGTQDQAVMIGDSDKDLGAAQNAEIDSILFYPDEHKKFYSLDSLTAHNPTHIVSDFRQVLDLV